MAATDSNILDFILSAETLPLAPTKVMPGTLQVVLDKYMYIFRHAKEILSGGHGDYLSGYVALPADTMNRVLRLELSLVPCLDQLVIHPNLLHIKVFGSNHRKCVFKSTLKSPSTWKLCFVIEYGARIFYVDNDMPETRIELSHCLDVVDGELRLSLGKTRLLINIVTPLQDRVSDLKKINSPPDSQRYVDPDPNRGLSILDVMRRRCEEENLPHPTPMELAKMYIDTGSQFRIELQRCRLRARIFSLTGNGYEEMIYCGISDNICNRRNNNVGQLYVKLLSHPGICCTQSRWKFTLVSEHRLANKSSDKKGQITPPVYPVLMVCDSQHNVVPNHGLPLNNIQIDKANLQVVCGNTFQFVAPKQQDWVIDEIRNMSLHLRIFLYRSLDGNHSLNSVPFEYTKHDDMGGPQCPFCLINMVSQRTDHEQTTICSKSNKRPATSPISSYRPKRVGRRKASANSSCSSSSGVSSSESGQESWSPCVSPASSQLDSYRSVEQMSPSDGVQPWDLKPDQPANILVSTQDFDISMFDSFDFAGGDLFHDSCGGHVESIRPDSSDDTPPLPEVAVHNPQPLAQTSVWPKAALIVATASFLIAIGIQSVTSYFFL